MTRLTMKSIITAASFWALSQAAVSAAADHVTYPGSGKNIVLISGDEEYRSEDGMPMLGKILSRHHGFNCTVLFPLSPAGVIDPNADESLSHPEALDSADAIIMLIRFRKWPDETMKRFDAAMKRGVPVIALRTSTHAFKLPATSPFKDYNSFGKRMLGEKWLTHWGKHKSEATRGVIETANASHPVLRGVSDVFGNSDVYEAAPPADAKILLRGQVLAGMKPTDGPASYHKKTVAGIEQDINDPMMPVAWVRELKTESGKAQRIVTTTMGAATDLASEGLRRLVVNGVFWALGQEVPAKADVTPVGAYEPLMYGFNGFRKNVKPAEHALDESLKP